MHEVLVNRLGGLSLPRKSVVRLNDHPDMALDIYRGRKTTTQQQQLRMVCPSVRKEHPRVSASGISTVQMDEPFSISHKYSFHLGLRLATNYS